MRCLLLTLLLVVTATEAQIYQGCNISQVVTTDPATGYYGGAAYQLVLTFNDTMSFSTTAVFDNIWPRVRARMRIVTSRNPQHQILVTREQQASFYAYPNPNVLYQNTVRVEIGVLLEPGEIVTLNYFQSRVSPIVDLLSGGKSVPSFECTASMPNVTRLVGQVTTTPYLVLSVLNTPPIVYQSIIFSFSRPVVRCNDGGDLTPANFMIYNTSGNWGSLSNVCTQMGSVYGRRTWECTNFTASYLDYFQPYTDTEQWEFAYASPVMPIGICDREYNTTVVSDIRPCSGASLAPTLEIDVWKAFWLSQSWILDTSGADNQLVATYPFCGTYPPANSSETTLFFQGMDFTSQYMWTPYSIWTGSDLPDSNYRVLSSGLDVNMTASQPTESSIESLRYKPRFLTTLRQSIDDNGLYVYLGSTACGGPVLRCVLVASDVNATQNVLDYATRISSNVYYISGWKTFRNDLYGYMEGTMVTTAGYAYMYVYSYPLNATATVIQIVSAAFLSPGTLRLHLNNSGQLRTFQTDLLHYSCGNITSYSISFSDITIVDLTVLNGLCPGAYLYARANLTWSTTEWFSYDQNITVSDGNLVLFNATLFNRELGYLLDTLDLEFTPATELVVAANVSLIDLQCDGEQAQLVFLSSPEAGVARFNVSGCNPDVANPTVSLLGTSAVTTSTRGSQEETDFPVSAPWFPRLTNDFCTTGNLLILQFDDPVVPLETNPLLIESDCTKANPIVARGVTDTRIFLQLAAPDTCTISFDIVTAVPARVNVYGDWCQPFAQSLPVGVASVSLLGTERLIVRLNRTFASIAELDASLTNPESYYVACPTPSTYQSRVSRLIDYSNDTLRFAVEGCSNQTDAAFFTTSAYSRESYVPVISTLQASVAETVSCVEQGSTVVSARISGEWELVSGAVTANSPCQVASVEAWDKDLVFEVANITDGDQCVLTANVSLLSVPGFYETILFPLQACVYSNELRPSGTFSGMALGGQVAFTMIVTFGLAFGILLALAFLYPACCLSRTNKRGS